MEDDGEKRMMGLQLGAEHSVIGIGQGEGGEEDKGQRSEYRTVLFVVWCAHALSVGLLSQSFWAGLFGSQQTCTNVVRCMVCMDGQNAVGQGKQAQCHQTEPRPIQGASTPRASTRLARVLPLLSLPPLRRGGSLAVVR